MNGIINVYKPEGITSFGVIREVKRISGEKKIGHIGTLDPLAEGVLPLFLGKMTKLIPYFNIVDKKYEATVKLGAVSTTLDREGELSDVPIPGACGESKLESVLSAFLGETEQLPPMYSAVKVDGKKLYQYARKGQEIERKPRKIVIHDIQIKDFSFPEFTFSVKCSKGTYIRVLADDIAKKLGTRGYLKALRRTHCGEFFTENNAINLNEVKKIEKTDLQSTFIDPQYILSDWHSVEVISAELQKQVSQGRTIPVSLDTIRFSGPEKQISKAIARDQNDEVLAVGVLEFSQDSDIKFRPEKVFI